MRELTIDDALKIKRPALGDTIPLSLWRILRLVVMPKVFGKDAGQWDRKLGLEFGALLDVEAPDDIIKAINDTQIGLCNPLEQKGGFYAIEFTECFTCSGIEPPVGKPICDFEAAIIEGCFLKMGMKVESVRETKCMGGLGDEVCRIEVNAG